MIKRDTLMKNARDVAAQRASVRPSIIAAYLTGSVARGEPSLGEACDLDLILIDDAQRSGSPLPPSEDVRLSTEIVVEITYRRPEFFKDTAALRNHHWLGPEIAQGLALHDPNHFFERVQAGVRGRFDQPTHVYARAQGFLEWARGDLAAIAPCLAEGPASERPTSAQLSSFALTLQFAAGAVLTLDRVVGSARRLMVRLDETAHVLGRPDLYAQFVEALNAASLTEEEIEALLSIWAALYGAASEFHRGEWGEDFFVQPVKRNYYERAMRALVAEGRGRDAVWLALYTAAACANQVSLYAPAGAAYLYLEKWERALERLGLNSAAGFARGVGLARDYVEKVTEFVEWWGEQEGA